MTTLKIGDQVNYFKNNRQPEPMVAFICRVYGEGFYTVAGFDWHGTPFNKTNMRVAAHGLEPDSPYITLRDVE